MPKTATLTLSGIIMPEAWNWFGEPIISLAGVQAQVKAAGEFEQLLLDIDSDGGVIEEGWRVYDYLMGLGVVINTQSIGVVASMATDLFLLGTTRLLSPHAKFIVHQPSGGLEGNINDFKEYLEGLEFEQARMLTLYASVTGKPEEEIAALLADGKDHSFSTQEAIDYGWATGIYESTNQPATARRSRQPIMAHLSEGRKALNLPEHKSNTIDMTKVAGRLSAAWKAIEAALTGGTMVALLVDTADGKKLNIEAADDAYVIGDAVTYEDGSAVADGDIILSDGNTITVASGVITDIQEPDPTAEVEEPVAPEAVVEGETVTITKAEHDRLLSLESAQTATIAKVAEHEKIIARLKPVMEAMARQESADPKVARLPETPIEKRVPTEESATDRKKKRLEARKA